MSFVDITNTTREKRGVIYDIFATYNIILLDERRYPVLEIIREEYDYLILPYLANKEVFRESLSFEFEKKLNVSLTEVINTCENDGIFSEFVHYLK